MSAKPASASKAKKPAAKKATTAHPDYVTMVSVRTFAQTSCLQFVSTLDDVSLTGTIFPFLSIHHI